MSRHSKNNTASSVFTYAERQRLKKQNEWGEICTRVGSIYRYICVIIIS